MKRIYAPLIALTLILVSLCRAADHQEWIPLFNGENLDGWTPKFSDHKLGENPGNVFRVQDGKLQVNYEDTEKFTHSFGHLYYKTPYSHYKLRGEFRFFGEQLKNAPEWAFRNNGFMLHCQTPESVGFDQDFPTSIEMQFWGNREEMNRHMGNLYTPGTVVMLDGKPTQSHDSSSPRFTGLDWIEVEVEVHGHDVVIHRVNGEEVLRYKYPQLHDGTPVRGGHIAIQAETHSTEFRKIEILPLPGNAPITHNGSGLSTLMNQPPRGYKALFNGENLDGWKMHPESEGHWKVDQGVIDYDAQSEAPNGEKHLWTEESFRDFELHVDWRIKEAPADFDMTFILPDGTNLRDENGEVVTIRRPNADSGILLRGEMKSQCNIWCWPVGSGEVWGYRNDERFPTEVHAGVTPDHYADKPVGQWNNFVITMKRDRLTVVLNGVTIIEDAQLPGVPERGPIGLQHHGGKNEDGTWNGASSLVQFRNIFIRKL